MTGGEELSDGPHQQAEDRTGCTSHLPLERGKSEQKKYTEHVTEGNGTREHQATQRQTDKDPKRKCRYERLE